MYQQLTAQQQLDLIDQVAAATPTATELVAAAEKNHWQAVIEATVAGTTLPDYVAPDTTAADRQHAALDALRGTVK